MKFIGILAGLLCFLLAGKQEALSRAADNPQVDTYRGAPTQQPDVVEFYGEKYYEPKFENIIKLLWRYDILKPANDMHLTLFLQISECDLYKKYFYNELEWGKILDTMRSHLRENRESFPNRIYFDSLIEVGNYDTEREGFEVLSEELKKGMRNFVPGMSQRSSVCGFSDKYGKTDIPKEVIYKFRRPVVLPFIPVKRELAENLIDFWAKKKSNNRDFKRLLYLRMFVQVKGFIEYKQLSRYSRVPVFISLTEGYMISTLPNFANIIYKEDLLRRNRLTE